MPTSVKTSQFIKIHETLAPTFERQKTDNISFKGIKFKSDRDGILVTNFDANGPSLKLSPP